MRYLKNISPMIFIIMLLSLIGSFMIYYGTYWGPWAYSDSTEYIVSARNLISGRGLGLYSASGHFEPFSLHAPLYPLLLSAVGLTGLDLIAAARWINIVLFGATILVTGAGTYLLFKSAWLSLSLSVLLLTLPSFVDISSGAMTELLFLFTGILGSLLLFAYLAKGLRLFLVLSAVSISLACLSRYPGVMFVPAGVIILLLNGQSPWKRRILDAVFFSLVSLLPIALWLGWVGRRTATLAARSYHFPANFWSVTAGLRLNFMQVFWDWLPFHDELPAYTYNLARNVFIAFNALIIFLVLLLLSRRLVRRSISSNPELKFASLWIIYILATIGFFFFSYIFTSPLPDINLRTLLPVQIGIIFMVLALIAAAIREYELPLAAGWVCAGVLLVFSFSFGSTSWRTISQYHQYGAGYTSKAWQESSTLKTVKNLPANIPIITDEPAAILLLLNRPAYAVCTLPCNSTGNLRYGDNLEDPIQGIFRNDQAALVYFYLIPDVLNQPGNAETRTQFDSLTENLKQYFYSDDGAIFFYPSIRNSTQEFPADP